MHLGHALLFGLGLLLAVGFILVSGAQLPATVASHFGAFLPRHGYLALMAGSASGLPLAMVLVEHWMIRNAPQP